MKVLSTTRIMINLSHILSFSVYRCAQKLGGVINPPFNRLVILYSNKKHMDAINIINDGSALFKCAKWNL